MLLAASCSRQAAVRAMNSTARMITCKLPASAPNASSTSSGAVPSLFNLLPSMSQPLLSLSASSGDQLKNRRSAWKAASPIVPLPGCLLAAKTTAKTARATWAYNPEESAEEELPRTPGWQRSIHATAQIA